MTVEDIPELIIGGHNANGITYVNNNVFMAESEWKQQKHIRNIANESKKKKYKKSEYILMSMRDWSNVWATDLGLKTPASKELGTVCHKHQKARCNSEIFLSDIKQSIKMYENVSRNEDWFTYTAYETVPGYLKPYIILQVIKIQNVLSAL